MKRLLWDARRQTRDNRQPHVPSPTSIVCIERTKEAEEVWHWHPRPCQIMSGPSKVPRLPSSGSAPDIEDLRRKHDKVFLGRLDGILQKYDRDFHGVADEIDLSTGEIVVNNGHISGARDSYDIGRPAHRPAPYVPVEAQNMARRPPVDASYGQEFRSIVHHHYAPGLHQSMPEQRSIEPDFASSVLRILERIERIEARNEIFHNQIAGQLGLLPPNDASTHHTTPSQPSSSHQLQQQQQQHRELESSGLQRGTENDVQESLRISPFGIERDHALAAVSPTPGAAIDESIAALSRRRKGKKRSHDVWAVDYTSSPEAQSSTKQRKISHREENAEIPHKPKSTAHKSAGSKSKAGSSTDPKSTERKTAADRMFWTAEKNKFLIDLARNQLRHPARKNGGRWQHILSAFSDRFPGRGLPPLRMQLSRLVPGGMAALRQEPENWQEGLVDKSAGEASTQTPQLVAGPNDTESSQGANQISAADADAEVTDQGVPLHPPENQYQANGGDIDLAVGREHSKAIQEGQQVSRKAVSKAESRLAHRLRMQDKHDRRMRIPPPRIYADILPYDSETSRDVRRSGRSRAQTSMRELLAQYEANFLESDSDGNIHSSDWSSVSSLDEDATVQPAIEETQEPQHLEKSIQEDATQGAELPAAVDAVQSLETENQAIQSQEPQPPSEEHATKAPTSPIRTPPTHTSAPSASPASKAQRTQHEQAMNSAIPILGQPSRDIQTPQKTSGQKTALGHAAPARELLTVPSPSRLSATPHASAYSSPKVARAYPSPDSAHGKPSSQGRITADRQSVGPQIVPDSDDSEPVSSSAAKVSPRAFTKPKVLLRPETQKKQVNADEQPAFKTPVHSEKGNASIGQSAKSNPSTVAPPSSIDSIIPRRGRGRPRKGEVVHPRSNKSAKKPQKNMAALRNSEVAKISEPAKQQGSANEPKPAAEQELPVSSEFAKILEPSGTFEPVRALESAKKLEPAKTLEPATSSEPVETSEPVTTPKSAKGKRPTRADGSSKQPKPARQQELLKTKGSASVEEPAKEQQPAEKPAEEKEVPRIAEPVVRNEPSNKNKAAAAAKATGTAKSFGLNKSIASSVSSSKALPASLPHLKARNPLHTPLRPIIGKAAMSVPTVRRKINFAPTDGLSEDELA